MALRTKPKHPMRLGQQPPRKPRYVGLPTTNGVVFVRAATGEAKAKQQPQPQTKPVPSRPKKGAPRRVGKGVCSSTLRLLSSESRFQKHCTDVVHSCPIHLKGTSVSARDSPRQEAFSTRCGSLYQRSPTTIGFGTLLSENPFRKTNPNQRSLYRTMRWLTSGSVFQRSWPEC